MDRLLLRRLIAPDATDILQDLTVRQHVQPHRAVGETLSDAAHDLGFCASVVARSLEWLRIEPAGAIGRLRRDQLIQLSRSVHRFWRQSYAAEKSHAG